MSRISASIRRIQSLRDCAWYGTLSRFSWRKENKKFFFGHLKQGARAKDFELAIEWLLDCGLIGKVYRVEKPAVPLKAYVDFSAFKIYLSDVGTLGGNERPGCKDNPGRQSVVYRI